MAKVAVLNVKKYGKKQTHGTFRANRKENSKWIKNGQLKFKGAAKRSD